MAWYKRYQIPFTSFSGTNYCAYIYEKTSGSLVTLTGAEEPFVTHEDDDTDIFTPIRKQTGYLRVVDETNAGTLLETLLPNNNTEKMVRLYSGTMSGSTFTDGAIQWQGFMCAQAFSQAWDGQKKVLEFPIKSFLAALEDLQMPVSMASANINLISILVNGIDGLFANPNVAPMDWLYLCDDHVVSPGWFRYLVTGANFFNIESQNLLGQATETWVGNSFYNALESVMKLFGLQAREYGASIYLAHYDHPDNECNMYKWTWANAQKVAREEFATYDWLGVLPDVDMMNALTFKGIDNKVDYILGGKKAAVRFSIHNTSFVAGIPDSLIDDSEVLKVTLADSDKLYGQPHPARINQAETFDYYEYQQYSYIGTSNYNTELQCSLLKGYSTNPMASSQLQLITGAFPVRWYCQRDEKEIIALRTGLWVQSQYYWRTSSVMHIIYRLSTVNAWVMNSGYLNLNLQLHNLVWITGYGILFDDIPPAAYTNVTTQLNIAIRVGDKFWDKNNETWIDNGDPLVNYCTFIFDGPTMRTNKTDDIHVDASDGWFIPVDNTTEDIEIYILDYMPVLAPSTPAGSSLISYSHIITDFKLEYYPLKGITTDTRDSNVYQQTILASGFSEEKAVDLSLGTMNNNEPATSFLMTIGIDDNLTYVESADFSTSGGSENTRPEIHLLSRMVAQYSTIRRSFRGVVQNSLAVMLQRFTYLTRKFFGVTRSRRWREDTAEITFIEVT